jgi:hypothetical protein
MRVRVIETEMIPTDKETEMAYHLHSIKIQKDYIEQAKAFERRRKVTIFILKDSHAEKI